MHQPSDRWQLGLALSLFTVLLWGSLPVAIKGLLASMDVNTIIWYRMLVSTALVGCYYAIKGGYQWRKMAQPKLGIPMLVAVIGLCGNYFLWVRGLDLSSPEAAQLVIQVAPMLLLLASVWLYKEAFRGWQKIGVAIFTLGLLLFFNHRLVSLFGGGDSGDGDSQYNLGVIIVFISALSWTIYALAQKQLLKEFGSQEVLLTIYIAGAIIFFPLAKPEQLLELNRTELYCLIFASINTALSYGAFAMAMEHWQASRVSATITIVPLTSLFFVHLAAWLMPDMIQAEALNWLSWLGAFMVVAGSMTSALVRPKQQPIASVEAK
ncbi:DMT family transporter [uncultured Pseudoteredinibacter sp.]|uniref:DMT family transporter n=1 Tax=uncultured Pseudoteredinibacter sp. TaxID=1641701 RepID=UPI0026289EA9|nr:DMT family transporter [uncultured Pseudoteredinibacter sp.]